MKVYGEIDVGQLLTHIIVMYIVVYVVFRYVYNIYIYICIIENEMNNKY